MRARLGGTIAGAGVGVGVGTGVAVGPGVAVGAGVAVGPGVGVGASVGVGVGVGVGVATGANSPGVGVGVATGAKAPGSGVGVAGSGVVVGVSSAEAVGIVDIVPLRPAEEVITPPTIRTTQIAESVSPSRTPRFRSGVPRADDRTRMRPRTRAGLTPMSEWRQSRSIAAAYAAES